MKFNAEQLLFTCFLDVMCIFGTVEPKMEYNWPLQYRVIFQPYVYVHVERAHLVGMELRPWDNIRISLSQNMPNPRFLSIKFELKKIFKIQT